jgi:FkbM family methyltransferase
MFNLRILLVYLVSVYLRTFRWEVARWRLVTYALHNIKAHGSLMGKAIVTTHFGFKMELYLHDWVDQHIYATGNYEDMTAMTISALLNPGDTCIDVGANIGFFSLLMAKCVGVDGSVLAFEPSPQTRGKLLYNIKLNQVTHVTVREEAVANVDGESLFFGGSEDHSGIANLRPLQLSNTSYEVRTCKLTSCIPETMKPQLIKIDIEGAEHLALQGMRELLQAQHPDIIIEMSDHFLREMKSSSAEVYAFLMQFGYHMYRIDWDGLIAYDDWDSTLPTQFNALFTVRKALPSQLVLKGVGS